jgi:hypothetical protein
MLHRMAFAVVAMSLTLASFSVSPAAAAETCQKADVAREGAGFITGAWNIEGSYDEAGREPVGFTVTFASDGTFVDRDNYRGRWLISGSSFTMYYPDESQLGYVGAISGDMIIGRFEGLQNSGAFQMSRSR